jgi:hypothetical protein
VSLRQFASRNVSRAALSVLVCIAVVGCSNGEEPSVATTLTITPGTATFDAIGATSTLTATVKDQKGNGMSGATVTWSSSAAAVTATATSTTTADGTATTTLTAVANGNATITATAGAATGSISAQVTQTPAALVKVSGDAQTGTVNSPLGTALQVRVNDRLGAAVAGVAVSFAASAGAVSSTSGTSAADGTVATVWTLSANASASHQVTVSAGALSATFSATPVAGAAATVAVNTGASQSATVGSVVTTAPSVRVTDTFGNPVAGAVVTFATTSGSGSASGATQTTNSSGVATVGGWTLGTTVGTHTLTATVGTLTPALITATATAGAAAAVTIVAGNGQSATVSTAVATAPSVRVTDAFGNNVSSIAVTFSVASGGGSVSGGSQTTNSSGVATVTSWTLGSTAGANTLLASAAGVTSTVTFTATGTAGAPAATPASVIVSAGDNVAAMVSTAVPTRPAVLVRDASSNPVAGATVTFEVTSGGGSITGATVVTGASGVATVGSWTLGPTAGANTLTATVTGATGSPVTFTDYGCTGGGGTGFAITLCYTTTMTTAQRNAFDAAAARWAQVITGDLSAILLQSNANECGTHPSTNLVVDDLLIFVSVGPIDGVSGTLGQAGPCRVRDLTGFSPVSGVMEFDVADMAVMEANGRLGSVILHEMGHVLGIGTIWEALGLLQNPGTVGGTLRDVSYSGTNGIAGFNAIGGATYTGGAKVPVENTGGEGTMNGHWRESLLSNELMTGFISGATNPLSLLTVRSLQDLGYTVSTAAADAFSVTLSLRAGPWDPRGLQLFNDVRRGPIRVIDASGRVIRIILP